MPLVVNEVIRKVQETCMCEVKAQMYLDIQEAVHTFPVMWFRALCKSVCYGNRARDSSQRLDTAEVVMRCHVCSDLELFISCTQPHRSESVDTAAVYMFF